MVKATPLGAVSKSECVAVLLVDMGSDENGSEGKTGTGGEFTSSRVGRVKVRRASLSEVLAAGRGRLRVRRTVRRRAGCLCRVMAMVALRSSAIEMARYARMAGSLFDRLGTGCRFVS